MTITADQIAEYLQDHLDFFEQHPELVRELILPTKSGDAISLVEFQLRKNCAIVSNSSKEKMIT